MTRLYISRLHFPVTTLGPGRRIGIWLQGCSIRCPGCISVDTWEIGIGETTVEAVLKAIIPWLRQADGVTISGGEPFDQPAGLEELLRGLRAGDFDGDVLLFTGYPFNTIQGRHSKWLSDLVDGLITEPYDRHSPQTLALRGSDNQQLHCLTTRGVERFAPYDRTSLPAERRLEVMFDSDGTVWMAGITAADDLRRLRDSLEIDGHSVELSQDFSRGLSE